MKVLLSKRSKELDAYLDDLQTRASCSLGIPSEFLDCDGDPAYRNTLKHMYGERYQTSSLHFPCPSNGEMVTLSDCWDCPRSQRCDIYATMLDENL